MAFALRARVVFPVDRPPIEGGVVTIEGDRIVAVGTETDAASVDNLGDVALLPGLVNAHTHLEFSYLQNPLGKPGMRLVDWIRLVIAERASSGTFASSWILSGFTESLRSGVTTIGDIMQGFAVSPIDGAAEQMLIVPQLEVIGFSRARVDSAFAATIERLDLLSQRVKLRVDISPHAPYTVSPVLFRRLVELASDRTLLVATHLAESEEELQLLANGAGPFQELLDERSMWDAEAIPRGSRPLDYLRILAEAPRALVIHGNYLDAEEHAFLAANSDRMSLVYCPRTHAYFEHPTYPLPALLENGVRVALGTDSRASNPDLDLLAEMRHVAALFPSTDPQTVLRMGTLAGAEALGCDAEVGSIMSGKMANLIAIPLQPQGAHSAEDALSEILASDKRPCRIWIRGDTVTSNQD
jgi:cytosine/adenosine deaminase-related metal-dependent hydrolase